MHSHVIAQLGMGFGGGGGGGGSNCKNGPHLPPRHEHFLLHEEVAILFTHGRVSKN